MLIPSKWHSRQFILCCSILLLVAGCGLSEMFSGSNAEKISEPCLELIPSATPTPTPAPIQTVIPVVTITPHPGKTPMPGKTPTPSQSCGNAPGIVLICDGEPVEETPITVITPPPVAASYVIHIELTTDAICSGSYTLAPLGTSVPPTTYNTTVSPGATKTFVISTGVTACSNTNVFISPASIPYTLTPTLGFPKTLVVGPVTQNIPMLSLHVLP